VKAELLTVVLTAAQDQRRGQLCFRKTLGESSTEHPLTTSRPATSFIGEEVVPHADRWSYAGHLGKIIGFPIAIGRDRSLSTANDLVVALIGSIMPAAPPIWNGAQEATSGHTWG